MEDIGTAGTGGEEYYYESENFDGESRQIPSPKEPKGENPNDSSRYRWRGPILTASEERDLLRRAKAGDDRVKDELVRRYHRLVLKIAGQYHGPSHEDLVAAGEFGFWEAILRFDLNRNNGLRAYAEHHIRNRLREAVRQWRRRAQAGETRADRWVYDHRNATAEEVVAAVGCKLKDAAAAIQRADCYWNGHERYDTTESSYDEDDNFIGPRAAVAHDIYSFYGFYGKCQLVPQLRVHERVSRTNDALAVEADKRSARRLKEIGRRAYALELVERDRARIAVRGEPIQYLYPWLRPQPIAAQPAQPRRRRKPRVEVSRRPRIRSWRWSEAGAVMAL